jgi:hypothetical protein
MWHRPIIRSDLPMPPDHSQLPASWPERKAWLEKRFEHLDPEVREREIEFHRLAFERGPSSTALKRGETFRKVLDTKRPGQKKIFRELVKRDLP